MLPKWRRSTVRHLPDGERGNHVYSHSRLATSVAQRLLSTALCFDPSKYSLSFPTSIRFYQIYCLSNFTSNYLVNYMADLEPLDPQFVQTVLSNPPFVSVPGVHNVRDLGLYPAHISFSRQATGESDIEGDRNGNASLVTRPGYMFRSAEVSGITEEGTSCFIIASLWFSRIFISRSLNPYFLGEAQLLDLGITTIFDLRSETEMKKYNTPLPALIHCHGKVTIVKSPVFEQKDYSPEMMARCVASSERLHETARLSVLGGASFPKTLSLKNASCP